MTITSEFPVSLTNRLASLLPEPSVDLLRASYRSDDFPKDWSREQREAALDRYRKWLGLKLSNPTARLAPTRDIDLFWHLHMLAPVAYFRDCKRYFGRLLDHDGGFGKDPSEVAELDSVLRATAELWERTYGIPYLEDGRWMRDVVATDCWHDCANRCWHACSNS